ncbi:MAG TPA: Wzz/FepE/Etk N-terminal domain-containing protein [Cyclobacteriaceae bacterium]|nr:Wzz/FepE/Etk N-terminal domain-containing protein [Cyclobacteriaceae bacterium]
MEKQTGNDEIDLVELLVKAVLLIKRNLVQIIIFFVVGTGLGYAYASLAPKVYESKMLISSEILTESYSEKIFETLQNLVKEQNYEDLSSKIGLTVDESKSVSKIKIESALKDKPQKEEEKRFFLITVELTDQSIQPKLQNGLIQFLQQIDFVKVRVEQRKKYYSDLIKQIDTEIQSLEEFKSKIYDGNFFQNSKGNVMFDPTTVNSKIVELTKERINYQNALETANSVQVVEGFTQFDKPIWPKKSVSLAAGASLGLFLVGIMIAFKSIRKLVRFAEEHPSQKAKS